MTAPRPTFGSLFAGIGGFDLGFERAGMECKWQVEIDPNCSKWLKSRWGAKVLNDARECGSNNLESVWGICGGFPCQNLSSANVKTREGLNGEKSGLWSEFRRIVGELHPAWVVVENSPNWREWVPSVRGDLWRLGYASVPLHLCTSMFGAYHRRPRVFVVANANGQSESLSALYEKVARLRPNAKTLRQQFENPTRFVPRSNGLPQWMARAYGNSASPIVTEWLGREIIQAADIILEASAATSERKHDADSQTDN